MNRCISNNDTMPPTLGIGTNMSFHPKVPLVTFLSLLHFRVSLLFPIFGRTRSTNNGGIHDHTFVHDQTVVTQISFYLLKQFRCQAVFLQSVPEPADSAFVRDC